MPNSVSNLFKQWRITYVSPRQKKLCSLSVFAIVWRLWLKRNSRVFRNTSAKVDEVADSVIWYVSSCVNRDKDFEDIFIHALTIFWDACFHMRSIETQAPHSTWRPPPEGVLKLNLDGSFLKEERKGGYGGVIRNNNDHILQELSSSIDCDNANGA